MLTLEQALAAILTGLRRAAATEVLALPEAEGRFLAVDVRAEVDNPAFDNSAMDGYAVRVADLQGEGSSLPVVGESRCGDDVKRLAPGTAMRIFTGAPLPSGADAVAIQEEVRREEGQAVFPRVPGRGANIRRRGEDFRAGEVLYRRGRRLRAHDLALLTTAGVTRIESFRRARALVIATGDELARPGEELRPGQIYESNRLAVLLQLRALGVDAEDGGIVHDDVRALRAALAASSEYDFIVTSGGASVGDHDLVRDVFSQIGEIELWNVRVKPGKPLAFGRIGTRAHFFALPGNPVSSFVIYKFFVEPAVIAWNHGEPPRPELAAVAANGFRRTAGRTEFLRARIYNEAGELRAQVLTGQGSHMLGTLRHTNAFIRVEADSTGFDAGEQVRVIPLTLDFS